MLVLGSAACASDVARDLRGVSAFSPELALGLEAAEFVKLAEEKFGVKIPDDEVKNLRTVGDAVSFIAKAGA